jgi:hypothetical protein
VQHERARARERQGERAARAARAEARRVQTRYWGELMLPYLVTTKHVRDGQQLLCEYRNEATSAHGDALVVL